MTLVGEAVVQVDLGEPPVEFAPIRQREVRLAGRGGRRRSVKPCRSCESMCIQSKHRDRIGALGSALIWNEL